MALIVAVLAVDHPCMQHTELVLSGRWHYGVDRVLHGTVLRSAPYIPRVDGECIGWHVISLADVGSLQPCIFIMHYSHQAAQFLRAHNLTLSRNTPLALHLSSVLSWLVMVVRLVHAYLHSLRMVGSLWWMLLRSSIVVQHWPAIQHYCPGCSCFVVLQDTSMVHTALHTT